MDLVIDGYNLLGSRGGLWGDVAAKRDRLIAELSGYARIKGHAIVVVFDGSDAAPDGPALPVSGVRVLFSRGERADDVVIRLSAGLGARGTIVSSDREVRDKCRPHGGVILGVQEFERRLAGALDGPASPEDADPDAPHGSAAKRGNPFRLSKVERKKRRRLERL